MNYIYTTTGPQRPVFLGDETGGGAVGFAVEGLTAGYVEVCDDPVRVKPQARVWRRFEGGLAGVLDGPPTWLRVVIVQQAETPVFLWVGNAGLKHNAVFPALLERGSP
ncbi:MAG: hypothetical protein WAX89_05660 [Alphaproteobacteria bacterium]